MSTFPIRLSVLVPVFDEARFVEAALVRVRALPVDTQVVCVDDGSTDGTDAILRTLHDRGLIDVLVRHERNRGKGAAVRTALAHADGDVVVIQDADLEYDPADLPRLLAPIADGRADAVIGDRFGGSPQRVLYFWHRVANGLLTGLSNVLTNLNLSDMECGYKLVKTDLMRSLPLTADRFGIEPELTARLAQSHARIYQAHVSYSGRTYAEGKKIRWRDGVAAVGHVLRFTLLPPRAPRYRPGPWPPARAESTPP
ncbi:MAG: glycosyltransferase family 2 protein [Gemmatirosa sp.]|nr:glycosyltransferase family 2 protein [Gemmatirosa sp.]